MNTLHILKSEPDELTRYIVEADCRDNNCQTVETFKPGTDWEKIVEQIFEADKVICWW